jgi:putative phosphoribosyl transferase
MSSRRWKIAIYWLFCATRLILGALMEKTVKVLCDNVILHGDLAIPGKAKGLVIFAHGSGSSRLSPRNRYVANVLQEANLATLLFDLMTAPEEAEDAITGHLRFDIEFLARRLVSVTDWVAGQRETRKLSLGYFGASTGAAAALEAAAERPELIKAVVSRGGRPDMAGPVLGRVKAPVLLIVGGLDTQVIELNEEAMTQLDTIKKLVIVPGASHLFEEPGTLPQVARLGSEWFSQYLSG